MPALTMLATKLWCEANGSVTSNGFRRDPGDHLSRYGKVGEVDEACDVLAGIATGAEAFPR